MRWFSEFLHRSVSERDGELWLLLICGLLPWNFLAAGLTSAARSVVANAGLIEKAYFSRSVLPAASVLSWNTNLLIELGVLSLVLVFVGQFVFIYLPLWPERCFD